MAADTDKKRQARSAYIFKRQTLGMIALAVGVSANTVGRWKKAAKAMGDDWDAARSAHLMAGQGVDAVIVQFVEEFTLMAQTTMEELKADALKEKEDQMAIKDRVAMLVMLSDAMVKMASSAGKLAPKVSELGVAQDVIGRLIEFMKENFPNEANALLKVIEPFSEYLVEAYG